MRVKSDRAREALSEFRKTSAGDYDTHKAAYDAAREAIRVAQAEVNKRVDEIAEGLDPTGIKWSAWQTSPECSPATWTFRVIRSNSIEVEDQKLADLNAEIVRLGEESHKILLKRVPPREVFTEIEALEALLDETKAATVTMKVEVARWLGLA